MPPLVNLSSLIDDAKCYELVRQHRWPDGVRCPHCESAAVARHGRDDTPAAPPALSLHGLRQPLRRPDRDHSRRTPSEAAGLGSVPLLHGPQPLEPADRQGARPWHLGRAGDDRAAAARAYRQNPGRHPRRRDRDRRGLCRGRAQGQPGGRRQKGRPGRRRRLRGAPGRGTLAKEKPPILGLLQRGGEVMVRMLANVQQTTIRPVIEASVAKGALVHTDEYDVYARLQDWSYGHKTVCHGHGEYARDDDGDGFCEVHVNTAEGFWSLLRSWLRPHRGISQEKLPAYLGFFQLVHNARRRGKALLGTLIAGLVAKTDAHHPETR